MDRIGRASMAIRSEVEERSVRSFSWRRLPQESLSESIIAQVRQELFSGKLRPGDYLGTEASLSQIFGVSRMATRDAVRALHASGVIESRPGNGGGIRIAHGDPDRFADALAIQLKLVGVSVKEIVDAHVSIETAAAELAATRATDADLEGLRNHLNDLRESLKNKDLAGYIDHLLAFHLALAQASHNRALSTLLQGYFGVLEDFYRGRASHAVGRRVERYLGKILEALKDRDREQTRTYMLRLFRPLANFEDRANR
jgi:GntR family transcriptional regulator, transcriptional repressor for pyruvate dehydrogenase complex